MKYLLGETTPTEVGAIQEWIAASPANLEYYQELKKVWDTSLQLATVSDADEHKAWERFQHRVQNNATAIPTQKRQIPWMRIAAAITVLMGLAVAFQLIFTREKVKPVIVRTINNVLIDTLPDGSMVTLNKQSSISYPSAFTGNTRDVALKGEAFFNVTPNKQKPFIIRVNDVEVTVVGTSFNVRSEKGSTEVIVETGIVRVTKNGETIELKAGEKTIVSLQKESLPKQRVDDQLYNYYRSRQFVCDNTPLWKLVEVLNEAYDAHIEIGRPELKTLLLTTTFNNESFDTVLMVISETLGVKVTRMPDKIILE